MLSTEQDNIKAIKLMLLNLNFTVLWLKRIKVGYFKFLWDYKLKIKYNFNVKNMIICVVK